MEFLFLQELIIIFGLSVAVLILCHRIQIPPIVGLLITGVLAGPHGFALVHAKHEIEMLAELGVVLLLFTIGTEFSLGGLLQIRKMVLLGGLVQVGLTFSAGFLLALVFGCPQNQAILIGMLLALSSTALVLKTLQERAELDSLYGRTTFAILIFQDLVIVPMMLLVPLLGTQDSASNTNVWFVVLKSVGILVGVLFAATRIVPILLTAVARTKNRELFLLTIFVICFTVAFLTQAAGLSLALGALLAGLIISESEYSHQALSNILPFQQVFTTLFFVSVGMLLDISFVLQNPLLVFSGFLCAITLKALLAAPAALVLGFSLRTSVLSGVALAQIGEFSFVLAGVGVRYNVIGGDLYQLFLSVSVLSICVTPSMISLAPKLADSILGLPLPRFLTIGRHRLDEERHLLGHEELHQHLVIIGFGLTGQLLARAARAANLPYVAIDLNPDRVKIKKGMGRHIVYGDGTQEAVLKEEGIGQAKYLAIAISDPVATRRIVAICRELNPSLHIIVKTRLVGEIDELRRLGANEVLSEEYEVAVETFSRILAKELLPREEIHSLINEVRAEGYQMIRSPGKMESDLNDLSLHVPGLDIFTYRTKAGAGAIQKTLLELQLRNRFGVTLLAVKRGAEIFSNPSSETVLLEEDIVVLLGPARNAAELVSLFEGEIP